MIPTTAERHTPPPSPTEHQAQGRSWAMLLLWLAACVLLPGVLSACGGSNDDPVSAPRSASAAIGPAGGTLIGPDGVELTVPPGALAQTTTLTITETANGAPAQVEQLQASGKVYEFTPHGLDFAVPVTIGFPLASNASTTSTLVSTSVFMVSPGEPEWGELETQVINGKATVSRNRLSWGYTGMACVYTGDPSRDPPSGCTPSSGAGRATATPSNALQQVNPGTRGVGASYTLNAAAQITFSIRYTTAYHCSGNVARLTRVPNDATAALLGPAVRLQEIAAPLTLSTGVSPPFMYAKGTATFAPITLTRADNGRWRYILSHSCTDAVTGTARSGTDALRIDVAVPSPTVTHTIGGSVSGLSGSGLVLQVNGGNNLAIAGNGAFTFATPVGEGLPYHVTVATQPSGQICAVANGSGTASAAVNNVAVTCSATGATHPIRGFVSNTASGPVTLQNNGTDTITVAANSSFSFPTPIATGRPFDVTVLNAPAGQTCVVLRGSGNAPQGTGLEVQVDCTSLPPSALALITFSDLDSLRTFKLDASTGAPETPSSNTTTGDHPLGVAVAPNRRFAYVTNLLSGTVGSYTIDAVRGQLTSTGSVAVPGPYAIALDPRSQFAWVLDNTNAQVRTFAVNPTTGALTASGAPTATATGGSRPHSLAVHPGGTHVYVTNEQSNSVSAFQVNPTTGALTLINTLANSVLAPQRIVVDPAGQFVYVTSPETYTVAVFQVNPRTGALVAAGSTAIDTPPLDIAMHPSGRWLFVFRAGAAVGSYAIDTTGAITEASSIGMGESGTSMAIDSAGNYLYVGINGLAVLSINSATGTLTDTGFFDSSIGNVGPARIAITP